jgi:hypothetical protein
MPESQHLGDRQEDHTFEASVGYVVKPCLKKEKEIAVYLNFHFFPMSILVFCKKFVFLGF